MSVLSEAGLPLTILISGLGRLRDAAHFVSSVREAADRLPVAAEVVPLPADPSFGRAMRAGFQQARGTYIITIDADYAGGLEILQDLWTRRDEAEVIVASRYVEGSEAAMPPARAALSRLLNVAFRRGLSVAVRDVSSAIRLYRADVVRALSLTADGYDVLPEVLVRAHAAGWRVEEIPMRYAPNPASTSKAHAQLATAYLSTFLRMWRLRNSIAAADYDFRAHDSPIPLQRYWQRSRYRFITELIQGEGAVLDVGCGSSQIIGALARGSVAVDILPNKLRFARRFGVPLVRASGFALPFGDERFPCVLCSQVIEHVPMVPSMIDELCRVLRPGGRLVLGTPDYDRWEWVWMEKAYGLAAPGGYADEHISHYTREGLLADFARRGYAHEATRYILRGELILAFRKPRPC